MSTCSGIVVSSSVFNDEWSTINPRSFHVTYFFFIYSTRILNGNHRCTLFQPNLTHGKSNSVDTTTTLRIISSDDLNCIFQIRKVIRWIAKCFFPNYFRRDVGTIVDTCCCTTSGSFFFFFVRISSSTGRMISNQRILSGANFNFFVIVVVSFFYFGRISSSNGRMISNQQILSGTNFNFFVIVGVSFFDFVAGSDIRIFVCLCGLDINYCSCCCCCCC
mmetsp:Transcript_54626/g.61991  ORF Transcript_54626/g.61991 Transcript_54626/m.61991 type:complete len:219 (+) Transcript_54626:942-1598(+)